MVWHCLEMFALSPRERNDFDFPVPNGSDCKLNRAPGVLTPVMFSYIADHLWISGSRVCEHLGAVAEVEIELTNLIASLGTKRHGFFNSFAAFVTTCVSSVTLLSSVSPKVRFVNGLLWASFAFCVVCIVTQFWLFK